MGTFLLLYILPSHGWFSLSAALIYFSTLFITFYLNYYFISEQG